MEVQAFEHGETLDLIVSGEAYEIQLTGQRAAHVRKLVGDALHADPTAGPVLITDSALRERIVAEVARHLLTLR